MTHIDWRLDLARQSSQRLFEKQPTIFAACNSTGNYIIFHSLGWFRRRRWRWRLCRVWIRVHVWWRLNGRRFDRWGFYRWLYRRRLYRRRLHRV
jgi:hypothetical protein